MLIFMYPTQNADISTRLLYAIEYYIKLYLGFCIRFLINISYIIRIHLGKLAVRISVWRGRMLHVVK